MDANQPNIDEPFVVTISLDRASQTPLHLQVSKPITQMIRDGVLAPGQLLEDEVTLANRLHVSRPTVRRAFQDMVSAGLLSRRRGVGTRVTLPHIQRQVALTSLYDDLEEASLSPRTDVLHYEVRLADKATALALQVDEGHEIVTIERLRWSKDNPLAIMRNTLPAEYAPSVTELTRSGLYHCLSERGIKPISAIQKVGAKVADSREAELLQIDVGAPLVTAERTAFEESGRVVDLGEHVYDGDQYHVTFTLQASSQQPELPTESK